MYPVEKILLLLIQSNIFPSHIAQRSFLGIAFEDTSLCSVTHVVFFKTKV